MSWGVAPRPPPEGSGEAGLVPGMGMEEEDGLLGISGGAGAAEGSRGLGAPRTWGPACGRRAHAHTAPPTFLLRGAGSSSRKASGSVSNPLSVWGDPKASPRYLGLAWGRGGDGVDRPLLALQWPLLVLLPLSDTSPPSFQPSFHGSQAAREAGQDNTQAAHRLPRGPPAPPAMPGSAEGPGPRP